MISGWTMVSIDSNGFTIKLNYLDPVSVSTHIDPDILFVQVQLSEFKDANGNSLPESVVKYIEIPTQIPTE